MFDPRRAFDVGRISQTAAKIFHAASFFFSNTRFQFSLIPLLGDRLASNKDELL